MIAWKDRVRDIMNWHINLIYLDQRVFVVDNELKMRLLRDFIQIGFYKLFGVLENQQT
jgi:hypothetical protein